MISIRKKKKKRKHFLSFPTPANKRLTFFFAALMKLTKLHKLCHRLTPHALQLRFVPMTDFLPEGPSNTRADRASGVSVGLNLDRAVLPEDGDGPFLGT